MDSGATSYISQDKNLFVELRDIAFLSIKMVDGSDVHAKGKGLSSCKINVSGSVERCKVDDVLYEPGLEYYSLSVLRMTKSGYKLSFEGPTCVIF